MPGTITPLLTNISLCEATTGWTAVDGTNTLNADVPIQSAGCIHNYSVSAGDRGSDYDFGADTNLSNTNLYFWFALSKTAIVGDYGSTGMRVRVTNSAGDWGEWYLFGKNTIAHNGWTPWTISTDLAFDAQSATPPSLSSIRKVGWRANAVLAKGYIYFDAWRYGTGLKITLGTAASPVTWEDIFAADNDSNNKYGVIIKYQGVYYLQGKLQFGDAAQTAITYFKDVSKIIIFQDAKVGGSFYEIVLVGATGYKTSFVLGVKSGTVGISGCIFNAASSTKPYKLLATDANIDAFGFYGCTFLEANTISLPADATNHEVLNSSFEKCVEVLVSTCITENCNFISADDESILLPSGNTHKTKNSSFINNPNATRIPNAGTYTFDGLKFTGNTIDIDNTSGGAVTVNCYNGANPTTETGDTTINTAVTLTVQGVKTGTEPTNYVRCRIETYPGGVQLMNEEANQSYGSEGYYRATESYNYTSDQEVVVKARYKGYLPFEGKSTITSSGLVMTAIWLPDPNYV